MKNHSLPIEFRALNIYYYEDPNNIRNYAPHYDSEAYIEGIFNRLKNTRKYRDFTKKNNSSTNYISDPFDKGDIVEGPAFYFNKKFYQFVFCENSNIDPEDEDILGLLEFDIKDMGEWQYSSAPRNRSMTQWSTYYHPVIRRLIRDEKKSFSH